MDPQETAHILYAYCRLYKSSVDKLDKLTKDTINDIKANRISHIDPMYCGLAFLHDHSSYTSAVVKLLEEYLPKFWVDKDGLVNEPVNYHFRHEEIYPLIFPNLWDKIFEYKVKQIFRKYEKILVEPMQKLVYETKVYTQPRFAELKEIKTFKDYPAVKSQHDFMVENDKNLMTENENEILGIILHNLIKKHSIYHRSLETDLKALTNGFEKDAKKQPLFVLAPVKSFDRALIKIKETIGQEYQNKFPMNSIKDLSRGSYIFENSTDLINFFNKLKSTVESKDCTKFKIYEVKNMFKNYKEEFSYKDIKIILGYKVNDSLWLTLEIQLILKDILALKKTLHKFYDISRADFQHLRLAFIKALGDMEEEQIDKAFVWDKSNLFYHIYHMNHQIPDYVSQFAVKENFYSSYSPNEMKKDNIYLKDGNYYSIEYVLDNENEVKYSMYPFQSSEINHRTSIMKDLQTKDTLFMAHYMYFGESKQVFKKGNIELKIDGLSFRIVIDSGFYNIGKYLSFDKSTAYPIGRMFEVDGTKLKFYNNVVFFETGEPPGVFEYETNKELFDEYCDNYYVKDYDFYVYYRK